jgi:hypothetical protein
MTALVSAITADVITELSQVPGVSTQIYAAPRIQQHIQDACILMMDEMWWPDLMQIYPTVTPNGADGRLTADLVSTLKNHTVSRFQDIEAVYPIARNTPLRILPPRFNPMTLSGSNSVYISPDAKFPLRPFLVWPVTSIDALVVNARAYPVLPISSTDTVYLDRLLITYLATYMFAEDDGTNPGAISKFKGMFEKRLQQAKAAWNQHPIQLDPRFPSTQDQWTER